MVPEADMAGYGGPHPGPRRRLRVLISSGIFPNRVLVNRGIYNLKAARALAKRCDVAVVAPVPYFPRFLRSRRYAWCAQVPRVDDVEGFHVRYPRYVITPKLGRSLHGVMLYLSLRGTYRNLVEDFAPDVILGYFAYPYGFANTLFGRAARVPVVTFCRGSDIHSLARHRAHAKMIAWSLRRCAKVFAVSEALKREIVALGVDPGHIVVIRNGIEPERFAGIDQASARARLGLPADGRLVVCVSRLSFEKGVDVLLDAVAASDGGWRLAVVGDGPEEGALRARARRGEISERVVFAGARAHAEVPLWIAAADVTALASRKEGHPNAVVESLAGGRPVVATRVGGVPEILTSDALGVMVEPEDPRALAAALDDAVQRAWDAGAIAAWGAARDWDAVASDMLAELERAAGQHPGPRERADVPA
jgi:glycosyltransferase involved in cell wall biosynthesis